MTKSTAVNAAVLSILRCFDDDPKNQEASPTTIGPAVKKGGQLFSKLTTFVPLQILSLALFLDRFHHRRVQHFIFDVLRSIFRDKFLPFFV